MDTPRPTIVVENLDIDTRLWPKAVNVDYDNGSRYGFRLGKIEFVLWKWPWPEWIGLPNRANIHSWLEVVNDWKNTNVGNYDIHYMDKCMAGIMKYV